eukprot:TRINITY_DN43450_c0_g1_i1.p1 TRINITY_DN43450_c0_g1~~TRINITY_DN43450_c0_g1_i1.p1  ORF type:complete len:374 (+),score=110.08 TRINITY_DN43450_c0_g1_i1:106-1122(+)
MPIDSLLATLAAMSPEECAEVLAILPAEVRAAVLAAMSPEDRAAVLAARPKDERVAAVVAMSALAAMPKGERAGVLASTPAVLAAALESLSPEAISSAREAAAPSDQRHLADQSRKLSITSQGAASATARQSWREPLSADAEAATWSSLLLEQKREADVAPELALEPMSAEAEAAVAAARAVASGHGAALLDEAEAENTGACESGCVRTLDDDGFETAASLRHRLAMAGLTEDEVDVAEERQEALRVVFEALRPPRSASAAGSGAVMQRERLLALCLAYWNEKEVAERTKDLPAELSACDVVDFLEEALPRSMCAFHTVAHRMVQVAYDLRLQEALGG